MLFQTIKVTLHKLFDRLKLVSFLWMKAKIPGLSKFNLGKTSCFPSWKSCFLTIRLYDEHNFMVDSQYSIFLKIYHIHPIHIHQKEKTISLSSQTQNLGSIQFWPLSKNQTRFNPFYKSHLSLTHFPKPIFLNLISFKLFS